MDAVTRDLECTNLLSGPFSQKALFLSLFFLSLSLSLYFHWPGKMLDADTRDLESTNHLSGPFSQKALSLSLSFFVFLFVFVFSLAR